MSAVVRGDARSLPLPDACVDLIVTSPPYFGLRSYTDGGEHYGGQIGSEATPAQWLAALVECTREWVRVLKPAGSIFVNLGDKYSGYSGTNWGHGRDLGREERGESRVPIAGPVSAPAVYGIPNKSLMGLPWRYALACTDQLGLILRRDIIWAKPNGLPESVTDRCRSSHEYVFHLVKQPRYYAAVDEIREPHQPQSIARSGRNRFAADRSQPPWGSPNTIDPAEACNPLGRLPGSVWDIPSQPLTVPASLGVDHFAAFPVELPRRIIAGWSPPGICCECGEGRRPVGTLPARTQEQLGAAIRSAREHLGLSRAELARRADCGANNVWDYEEGGHIPRGAAWDSLAAALKLGMSREEFTGERAYTRPLEVGSGKWYGTGAAADGAARSSKMASRGSRLTTITGYACACAEPTAPTRPAVVLDPFGGTGTTALAAHTLGRHGITLDRSADYCRLAAWRTTDPGELARAMGVPKPPPVPDGQDALFGREEAPMSP